MPKVSKSTAVTRARPRDAYSLRKGNKVKHTLPAKPAKPDSINDIELQIHPETSLLGLPAELRKMVWQYTFNTVENSTDMQPLLTCRMIYHECSNLAFKNTVFTLEADFWANTRQTERLTRALSSEKRKLVKAVRIVYGDATPPSPQRWPWRVMSRLAKHAIRPNIVTLVEPQKGAFRYHDSFILEDSHTHRCDNWLILCHSARTIWNIIERTCQMTWGNSAKWRLASSAATAGQEASASGRIDMVFETAAKAERIFSFKLKNFNAEHQSSTKIEQITYLVAIVQALVKDNRG